MTTSVAAAGEVSVEGEHLGRVEGFRFVPDSTEGHADQKAVMSAALRVLRQDLPVRLAAFTNAPDGELVFDAQLRVCWGGGPVARLLPSGDVLAPKVEALPTDLLDGPAREEVRKRAAVWVETRIRLGLSELMDARATEQLPAGARGIVFQLCEGLGVLPRKPIEEQLAQLGEEDRKALARLGVRVGVYSLYFPSMLKPVPIRLRAGLWMIAHERETIPTLPAEGRTSMDLPHNAEREFYTTIGYLPLGDHAIRADMVERLAAMARHAVRESREASRRSQPQPQQPPQKKPGRRGPEPVAAIPAAATPEEISEWAIVAAAFGESDAAAGPEPAADATPEETAPEETAPEKTTSEAMTAEPHAVEAASAEPAAADAPASEDSAPVPSEAASEEALREEALLEEPQAEVPAAADAKPDDASVTETASDQATVDSTTIDEAKAVPTGADSKAADSTAADSTAADATAGDATTTEVPAGEASAPSTVETGEAGQAEAPKGPRPLPPGWFRAAPQMMSLVGCSEPEMANVLRALGYRVHPPTEETGPLHAFSVKPRFVREREEQRERERLQQRQQREQRDQRRRDRPERPNERQFFADSPRPERGKDERGRAGPPNTGGPPNKDGPQNRDAPANRDAGKRDERSPRPPSSGPRDDRRGPPRPPRRDSGGPALRLYATTEKKGEAAADSPFAKLLELKLGGKK